MAKNQTNEQIILEQIVSDRLTAMGAGYDEDHFFELFASEQVTKEFDLSYDEIESGLLRDDKGSGTRDGGIDSIYLLVNGELIIEEDEDLSRFKRNPVLNVVICQAKRTAGFSEDAINRFVSFTRNLLDLSRDPDDLQGIYNPAVLESIRKFRHVQTALAPRFPDVQIEFFYVTTGTSVHPNVRAKEVELKAAVAQFPDAKFSLHFLTAGDLLDRARIAPSRSYTIQLAESPISSEARIGYICLVRLRDYFEFIADERKTLRRHLFEANVRDYQGSTEVNDEIQSTLRGDGDEDFWWLNNGVTIVASKGSQSGKSLTVEDPQIVNGLQTSTEIFKYYSEQGVRPNDARTLLVRVIVPDQPSSGDKIIKATNSQTQVQPASLRATDEIHRNIEDYLRPKGLFYDRRKNFHKNAGRARDKIISIPYLAQAMMAIVLGRPDTARARPSSLLKREDDYRRVYSRNYNLSVYHVAVSILKRVEKCLRRDGSDLTTLERNNLKFYVAMFAVRLTMKRISPGVAEIAQLDPDDITEQIILQSLNHCRKAFEEAGATDKVAKGSDFLDKVKSVLSSTIDPTATATSR